MWPYLTCLVIVISYIFPEATALIQIAACHLTLANQKHQMSDQRISCQDKFNVRTEVALLVVSEQNVIIAEQVICIGSHNCAL